jgi:hypothetical protein
MRSVLPTVPVALAAVILLVTALPVQGQPRYGLLWDPALSSEVGAENLATVRRGLQALENRLLPLRWSDESTPAGKALGVTYRLGRAFFLERPLTLTAWLAQHEVFGHGAGARHAGVRGTTYEISLPWPYGSGPSGRAFYPPGSRFGPYEDLHATAKGGNASVVLAQTVRDRAVRRGALFYDEVALGITGHLDLPLYILGTQDRGARGDIAAYLRELDRPAPSLRSLKQKALLGLADPFTLLALASSLRHHLWSGHRQAPLPTVQWRSVRYLPSFHLSLSPFGPEFLLEHLAVHDGRLWRLTTRLGNGPYGRFGGAGLAVTNVMQTDRLRTGARLDVWYQPTRLLNETFRWADRRRGVPPDPFAVGGRVEVSASMRPTPTWPVFATGTLGYKTSGFVLGEGLDAGPLVEVGLRLDSSLLE